MICTKIDILVRAVVEEMLIAYSVTVAVQSTESQAFFTMSVHFHSIASGGLVVCALSIFGESFTFISIHGQYRLRQTIRIFTSLVLVFNYIKGYM